MHSRLPPHPSSDRCTPPQGQASRPSSAAFAKRSPPSPASTWNSTHPMRCNPAKSVRAFAQDSRSRCRCPSDRTPLDNQAHIPSGAHRIEPTGTEIPKRSVDLHPGRRETSLSSNTQGRSPRKPNSIRYSRRRLDDRRRTVAQPPVQTCIDGPSAS